jgi:hypothetical protein
LLFDAAAGGRIFHAASGLDATAIADVQAGVRRRLLRGFVRRDLLPADDAQAMGQWQHGGGFSVDAAVRIAAADRAGRERLLRYSRPPAVSPGPAAVRYAWAMLIARIYEVFPLRCPRCGAAMRIIAFITDAAPIHATLLHLGEPTAPPRYAPARGPPLWEAADPEQIPRRSRCPRPSRPSSSTGA